MDNRSRLYAHQDPPKGFYVCTLEPEEMYYGNEKDGIIPYDDSLVIDGKLNCDEADFVPDWTPYMEYEFDERGVWSMFLLHISDSYLPVFQHGCYNVRHWFFTREDIDSYSDYKCFRDDKRVIPTVTITGPDTAVISACYSDFDLNLKVG